MKILRAIFMKWSFLDSKNTMFLNSFGINALSPPLANSNIRFMSISVSGKLYFLYKSFLQGHMNTETHIHFGESMACAKAHA